MGYHLQAIICKENLSVSILNEFKSAKRIRFIDNLFLIPYTGDLYDEVNEYKESKDFDKFDYLNERLFRYLLSRSLLGSIAYVEADYSGGTGAQSAIMLNKEHVILDIRAENSEYGAINHVFKEFGVTRKPGLDEWDTAGMVRHRHTEDWLGDADDVDNSHPTVPPAV
jgi:hypothetical protein